MKLPNLVFPKKILDFAKVVGDLNLKPAFLTSDKFRECGRCGECGGCGKIKRRAVAIKDDGRKREKVF
ncbi:MAG: hypothetical protein V7K26_31570 [Nostoc sp.]